MADEMERIEKALEGNGLALSAVAEVLQKMDARFTKAEEEEEDKREEEDAAVEKSALVKELATEVANMLKADQGMDVNGGERKAKTTGGSSAKADDSESAANISSKIEQQQNTIQAMRKGDDDEDDADDYVDEKKADDDEDADDMKEASYKKAHGDDDEDDGEDEEMKSMQKELDSLRKQLASFEQGLEKSVEDASEARLRKMGFREERGLVAPQMQALGTDGTTPLVKAADDGDTVDQLANLSYGELRTLQMKIQSGDTTGVPRELLNG
jgi:chromosome segregation ATPase